MLQTEWNIPYTIGDYSSFSDKVNIYYYLTGDSDVSRPWITGIPMDAIRSALDGIPARQKILLIDTCQSGEVIDITSYQPSKERLEELQKNMVILLQNRYVAMCLSV